MIDNIDSPIIAKNYISAMDVLIAARMHATVAGVQLKDTTKEEFFAKLKEILASMYSEGEI